jgi:hypothetical protein
LSVFFAPIALNTSVKLTGVAALSKIGVAAGTANGFGLLNGLIKPLLANLIKNKSS